MLQLTPMRFKEYIWPHNPRVYSIQYQRRMASHLVPGGLSYLQDMGRTNRILEGSGEFVGEGAYTQFGTLANVFYSKGPGLLIHPIWQASNAYFVSLRLEQVPRPDYVRYSFTFWEDDSTYRGRLDTQTVPPPAPGQPGQSNGQGTGRAVHVVQAGDSLWGIAARYGLTLEQLVALNPQIKNPNLIFPGQEVWVG